MIEPDPMLRRVERNSVGACMAIAVVCFAASGGDVVYALGAVGGGLIVAISYRGIKAGIDAATLVADRSPRARKAVVIGLVKFFTRYGILALAAYVIMARLRLPALAVIAGASSLVVAVTLEAVRPDRKEPPHNVE